MENLRRAEKYFELFLDACLREKNAINEAKRYRKAAETASNDWWDFPSKSVLQKGAIVQINRAKSARKAKIKIHKTLISVLGILKNEK